MKHHCAYCSISQKNAAYDSAPPWLLQVARGHSAGWLLVQGGRVVTGLHHLRDRDWRVPLRPQGVQIRWPHRLRTGGGLAGTPPRAAGTPAARAAPTRQPRRQIFQGRRRPAAHLVPQALAPRRGPARQVWLGRGGGGGLCQVPTAHAAP